MNRYWVRYKCEGMIFWRWAFGVVGDVVGFRTSHAGGAPIPQTEPRIFMIKHNGKKWDLPFNGTKIVYSKNRERVVSEQLSKESGQNVK